MPMGFARHHRPVSMTMTNAKHGQVKVRNAWRKIRMMTFHSERLVSLVPGTILHLRVGVLASVFLQENAMPSEFQLCVIGVISIRLYGT